MVHNAIALREDSNRLPVIKTGKSLASPYINRALATLPATSGQNVIVSISPIGLPASSLVTILQGLSVTQRNDLVNVISVMRAKNLLAHRDGVRKYQRANMLGNVVKNRKWLV